MILGNHGSRIFKLTYYPHYKKAIGTGVANMPFSKTIGQIIANLSVSIIFVFVLVRTTFVTNDDKMEGYEVEVMCMRLVYCVI